jgi:adenylyltransferase/sulfurtransferase
VRAAKPNVYGSVSRFEGQVSVFAPHLGGPCYRCLFPQPPPAGTVPSCAENGVLGVLPGIIGTMQALEAIKLVVGFGELLVGRLLHIDGAKMQFRAFNVRRDAECPACGSGSMQAISLPTQSLQPTRLPPQEISVQELQQRLTNGATVLVDVREPFEWEIAKIDDAVFMPLREVGARASELPRDSDIALICHSGVRSAQAAEFLRQSGFARVWNVTGGIDAWADEIEPEMTRY